MRSFTLQKRALKLKTQFENPSSCLLFILFRNNTRQNIRQSSLLDQCSVIIKSVFSDTYLIQSAA